MAQSEILLELSEKLGLAVSAFEVAIGASNGVISKSIKRGAKISPDIFDKIKNTYPQVNDQWLLTGKGEMFIGDKEDKEDKIKETGDGLALHNAVKISGKKIPEILDLLDISRGTLFNYFKEVKLDDSVKESTAKALGRNAEEIFGRPPQIYSRKVPILGEAAAGDMQMYQDNKEVEYIDVGDLLRDSESAFTVYGNSMNPNYPSGCILGIKRCYDGFIQPGEIYLLETKSNQVFKRLYYNDDRTGYTCHSDNTMVHETGPMKGKYYYPPFDVKFEDIIRLHDVTGMIKRTRNSAIINRQK